MKNQKEYAKFFRFEPSDPSLSGVIFTPLMGEVEADRIYQVNQPVVAEVLAGHDEWQPVTQKDYDAQLKADKAEEDHDEE